MEKGSLWSQIKRYVIVQYLSGQINPLALLALKNNLKLESHDNINIYVDSKGDRYVSTRMGFSLIERYNLAIKLRELNLDYEILLNEKNGLDIRLEEKCLVVSRLKEEIIELTEKMSVLKEKLESYKTNNFSLKVIKVFNKKSSEERLTKLVEKLQNDLVNEKLKNTQLSSCVSNNLGSVKKSSIVKIISNEITNPEQKIDQISRLFK